MRAETYVSARLLVEGGCGDARRRPDPRLICPSGGGAPPGVAPSRGAEETPLEGRSPVAVPLSSTLPLLAHPLAVYGVLLWRCHLMPLATYCESHPDAHRCPTHSKPRSRLEGRLPSNNSVSYLVDHGHWGHGHVCCFQ